MARQQQLGTRYAAGESPLATIWGDTKQWRDDNLVGDIATSFIPGIGQAGAIQDAQSDFSQGNYGMGTLAAMGAVPGLGAITKPIRAGIKAGGNTTQEGLDMFKKWDSPYSEKGLETMDDFNKAVDNIIVEPAGSLFKGATKTDFNKYNSALKKDERLLKNFDSQIAKNQDFSDNWTNKPWDQRASLQASAANEGGVSKMFQGRTKRIQPKRDELAASIQARREHFNPLHEQMLKDNPVVKRTVKPKKPANPLDDIVAKIPDSGVAGANKASSSPLSSKIGNKKLEKKWGNRSEAGRKAMAKKFGIDYDTMLGMFGN